MYKSLNADCITETAAKLSQRVKERFPDRGLASVSEELVDLARSAKQEAILLDRPNWLLRLGVAAVIATGILVFFYVGTFLNFSKITTEAIGLVQGLESAVNTVVLTVLGLTFLITTEGRLKRRRTLKALHQIRSIAHIIDMHQLTKDPGVLLRGGPRTASSPERDMDEFNLTRYLDYCSEMLSVCGKIAALYAENLRDPVVISTVNEIESLSTNLSRKIWQKIMIMHRYEGGPGGGEALSRAQVELAR